ncbi:hypothetical protein [uncultured Oscillibacter sp.]|uniref:hypothetical protein n=1 Tax=uncultured Oscillibacter sp. TaxID=876091 RepID=UPI00262E0637|nr:hypothetical protein [uncultured Oscillibacter sp.]
MAANNFSALTGVASYPDRGTGGSSKYRGICSPKLIAGLIAHFHPHEICDYMCGSNTTGDAAAGMGIASHTCGLHSGFDLPSCDIPERPQIR